MSPASTSPRSALEDILPVRAMNALQIVKAVYEALGRGALGAALDALDERVSWELYAPNSVPFAGIWRGRAGVVRYFAELSASVDIQTEQLSEFVATGDRVVAIGRLEGRVQGTSLVFNTPITHIWELSGGRITRWRCLLDSAQVAACFLAAPSYIRQAG